MIASAFKDTLTLMNVRYQIIRETKGKIGLWAFIIMIAFGVYLTSYTGQLIKIMANSQSSNLEAAKIYATTYLNSYLNGHIGGLVATTLGLAIISVMIAPFTGASATSLISHHYMVGVRANMRHRFTDSIVTQFVSSISLLQLLTLTSVASLLTIDGGRKEGILYAWASWPVLVILSTMFVWLAEYLYRKFGEKKRLAMLSIALGAIALVVYYNQEQAVTVFGIGTAYADIIKGFHTFDLFTQVLSFGILIGLWLLFAFCAYKMSQVALSHPDIFAKQVKKEKTISSRKASALPLVEMCHLALMQVWRNIEIRKPIMMTAGFSIVAMWMLAYDSSLLATLVFVIPLMISLSWGANIFGILGNGLPWIISKPFSMRSILWVFGGLQLVMVLTLASLTLIPVVVFGKIDVDTAASFIIAVFGCSVVMTRSAISKSVYSPHPYKSGYRGEPILPPATLIAYTFRFVMWSGMLGLIVFTMNDILIQLGLVLVVCIWTFFRFRAMNNKFQKDPSIRNKIVFTVAYN